MLRLAWIAGIITTPQYVRHARQKQFGSAAANPLASTLGHWDRSLFKDRIAVVLFLAGFMILAYTFLRDSIISKLKDGESPFVVPPKATANALSLFFRNCSFGLFAPPPSQPPGACRRKQAVFSHPISLCRNRSLVSLSFGLLHAVSSHCRICFSVSSCVIVGQRTRQNCARAFQSRGP